MSNLKEFDSDTNGPPKENRRVRCLACCYEFESDEMILDSTYEAWVCPHCLKAWGYGRDIVPIEREGEGL